MNLATQLMEGLHVNFNDVPASRGVSHSVSDDFCRLSSTQPEAPITDVGFEWERSWQSSSQPLGIPQDFSSQDFWASLAEDPTMSQFAPQPSLPLSLVRFSLYLSVFVVFSLPSRPTSFCKVQETVLTRSRPKMPKSSRTSAPHSA